MSAGSTFRSGYLVGPTFERMGVSRTIATYAAGGTLGSLFVAHGLLGVLRTSGADPSVRLDGFGLAWGLLVAFVGWAILIVTYVNLRAELDEP